MKTLENKQCEQYQLNKAVEGIVQILVEDNSTDYTNAPYMCAYYEVYNLVEIMVRKTNRENSFEAMNKYTKKLLDKYLMLYNGPKTLTKIEVKEVIEYEIPFSQLTSNVAI